VIYGSESLVGKGQYDLGDIWSRQNIIDEVFMIYQSIRVLGIAQVNYITRVPNSAQPYY
jgi:hypothetical protein